MRAVWIQFVFLSELEVLAKKCMMVRAFKTLVLNGQTCLSHELLEGVHGELFDHRAIVYFLALINRLRSEEK